MNVFTIYKLLLAICAVYTYEVCSFLNIAVSCGRKCLKIPEDLLILWKKMSENP